MGAAARDHRQPGACRSRQGRQATGTAAMMARQIAARGRLCTGAACPVSRSPALPARCAAFLRKGLASPSISFETRD
jgi:hypothetical protein